jgi:3-oxoacyl-[acyl-carrier-protein] synthase II
MRFDQRVFVTGCGAVSPLGVGVPAFWRALVDGRSGVKPIRSFDASPYGSGLAAEVEGFDAERHLSAAQRARLDRASQYAVVAAREALRDAALRPTGEARGRIGVILGTTLGGMALGEQYVRSRSSGASFESRRLLHFPYYALATRLARELDLCGPVISPSIACASGTQAVGQAVDLIRRGQADAFVVGGAEALCEFVVSGFHCLRATAAGAPRPFDARRDGLALGEGAAVLVVESETHARDRGARRRAEVAGSGLAGDAVHMTAPARDGAGAARAMRAALDEAGVRPAEVDFISAHGTGTVYNDAMEMAAIESVFGDGAARIPVNSIKGAIGHTLAAAGSFETILCVRVLAEGVIPPTAGCEELDPRCRLDVVRGTARRQEVRVALSTSSAFAGNNAAIVLRRGTRKGEEHG